jgi:biotin operon repressor
MMENINKHIHKERERGIKIHTQKMNVRRKFEP